MSRAFTRESDLPVPLPERPSGAGPNYLTARGADALRQRLAAAEAERQRLQASDDRAADPAALAAIGRDLRWLQARLSATVVVDVRSQPRDRVAFGATVSAEDDAGVMHLAVASGVPTAGLFSITDLATYAPCGSGHFALDTRGQTPLEAAATLATRCGPLLPAGARADAGATDQAG